MKPPAQAMMATVDMALRFWAQDRAEQIAIWVSGDALTYAEMDAWVDQIAASLIAAGIAPGDRVGFYGETCLPWCVATFAVIRVGAIVSPINSRMIAAEVDYLLDQYEPVAIFTDTGGAERLRQAGVTSPLLALDDLDALRGGDAKPVTLDLDPDAPVAIITTSGSTARPKGVVYSQRAMIDYAMEEHMHNSPDLEGGPTRLLSTSPLSTAGGCNLMIHSVVIGGTVHLLRKFDPAEALQTLIDQRINTFRAAPIFFQRIAEVPAFQTADITHIRIATIGGAAPAPWLQQAWWDRGVDLRQLYGQTEAGGAICINPRRHAKSDPDRCGFGGPFTRIAIVDEAGRRLPPNQPGQIIARKPGMMMGYWRNPEATAAALIDGWLYTGDVGVVDERGLLKIVDRMKDFIKSGGLNISSAELERVIMEVEGIEEVAVLAAPDEQFGEAPLAIVYGSDCSPEALLAHCRSQLSSYKLPRYVIVSDTPLPRLAMGKISKPALRRALEGQPLPPPVR